MPGTQEGCCALCADYALALRADPAGKQTINSMYGTRVAVLAGDYLFAQSSWFLANLDNLEVRPHTHLCVPSVPAGSATDVVLLSRSSAPLSLLWSCCKHSCR